MSYKLPPVTHGVFYSLQTQTFTGSTTSATSSGQTITFTNTVDATSGVILSGITKIVVTSSGDYSFLPSIIVDQGAGTNEVYEMWFQKNGVDIPDSNTRVVNATATTEQLIVLQFIVDLLANQYVELKWYCTTATGTFKSTAAGSRPAVPSVILTVLKVSE